MPSPSALWSAAATPPESLSFWTKRSKKCGACRTAAFPVFPNFTGIAFGISTIVPRRYVFLDLSDGSVHSTPLEIPVFPTNVLPDGHILGVNGKQDRLTVFDQNGTMVSRCSVPGRLCFSFISGGEVFLAEMRGLDKYGWLCDELFDEASAHVWRLDPAPKK